MIAVLTQHIASRCKQSAFRKAAAAAAAAAFIELSGCIALHMQRLQTVPHSSMQVHTRAVHMNACMTHILLLRAASRSAKRIITRCAQLVKSAFLPLLCCAVIISAASAADTSTYSSFRSTGVIVLDCQP
eukprot:18257-Heterococcus_DN1.PRE.2